MFRSIFRPYGLVWTILNDITDALLLSLLWCACSLPILTIGPASTALYDAAVHGIRYREEGTYRRFIRTFRRELKTGIAFTLLWGAVLLFCSYVLALLDAAAPENTQAALMAGAYRGLMTIPICAVCWSAAILSRFTYGFRDLTLTALRFLPMHLLASAGIGILTWAVIWYVGEFPLGLTFAPALTVLGWSLFAEPVFRKYGGGLVKIQPEADEAAEEE